MDGIPVTVTLGNRSVTGVTFVHSSEFLTPFYSIDISPLGVAFLQPVTITVVVDDVPIQRQVMVYPDFRTRNQRFDIVINTAGVSGPAPLWGHVVDFATGKPAPQAVVVVEHAGRFIVTETATPTGEFWPVFTVSQEQLRGVDAAPGSVLTLTARHGGDLDRQIVTLAQEPQQVNFATGWRCDDYDPLPNAYSSLPESLPPVASASLLPNISLSSARSRYNFLLSIVKLITVSPDETEPFTGGPSGLTEFNPAFDVTFSVYRGSPAQGRQASADPLGGPWLDEGFPTEDGVGVQPGSPAYELLSDITPRPTDQPAGGETGGPSGLIGTVNILVGIRSNKSSPGESPPEPPGEPQLDRGASLWTESVDDWLRVSLYDLAAQLFASEESIGQILLADSDPSILQQFNQEGLTPGGDSYLLAVQKVTLPSQTREPLNYGPTPGGPQLDSGELGPPARPLPIEPLSFRPGDASSGPVAPPDDARPLVGGPSGLRNLSDLAYIINIDPSPPDVTCFWGYVTVDQTPVTDALVYLEIGDARYETRTHRHPGETLPRFSMAVENQDIIAGAVVAVSAVYSGYTASQAVAPTKKAGHSPQIDLIMDTAGGWEQPDEGCSGQSQVNALAWRDGYLWIGTPAGVRVLHPSDGRCARFTSDDGLADNSVLAIAVDQQRGYKWMATAGGVSVLDDGGTPLYKADDRWRSVVPVDGVLGGRVLALAIDAEGRTWFGFYGGVSVLDDGDTPESPDDDLWQTFTVADGLADNYVHAIAIDDRGFKWLGTAAGVSLLDDNKTLADKTDDRWQTFSAPAGQLDGAQPSTLSAGGSLVDNWVHAIAIDGQYRWIGANRGVSRLDANDTPFSTQDDSWQTLTADDGLPGNHALAIAIDDQGRKWIGSHSGLNVLEGNVLQAGANNGRWRTTAEVASRQPNLLPPQSDLSVQIAAPSSIAPGQPFTYVLQVANKGQAPATDATLALRLPRGVDYLDAYPFPRQIAPLRWPLGTLPAGGPPLTLIVTATAALDLSPGQVLTASLEAATAAAEMFLLNNTAQARVQVSSPGRADVRIHLAGPPTLAPHERAVYQIWLDNVGRREAAQATLTVEAPAGMAYATAAPPPASLDPPTWRLGTLAAQQTAYISLTLTVSGAVTAGQAQTLWAAMTTSTPEDNPANNVATITTPVSPAAVQTLIVAAPGRMAARYGTPSYLSSLNRLAEHPSVQGIVLDVLRTEQVRRAYADWDANPGDWRRANAVATTIKDLIDRYASTYPGLRYLVLVGSDHVIPFYRAPDRSPRAWQEQEYRYSAPAGALRAALAANRLLTDDFYADQTPTRAEEPLAAGVDPVRWTRGHALYAPDLAIGRLVETPAEIEAVIDAFLANDGALALDSVITVGAIERLTEDLGQRLCETLQAHDPLVSCSDSGQSLRQALLDQAGGAAFALVPGNHGALGSLRASELLGRSQAYSRTLLVAIGCHAGLNVPDLPPAGRQPSLDLAQAFLGQGGTYIGSTAYSRAALPGLAYAEALMLELAQQLVAADPRPIGQALVQAKQRYFAQQGWFDHDDEKTLLPVTLYGLPMLRVATPQTLPPGLYDQLVALGVLAPPEAPTPLSRVSSARRDPLTVVTHTLSFEFSAMNLDGRTCYNDCDRQIVVARPGWPIQSTHREPIPATLDSGETVRGVLLRRAGYIQQEHFRPWIAQAWLLDARSTAPAAGPTAFEDWDWPIPYALGHFEGRLNAVASLNLVLGAYKGDSATGRLLLFEDLTLEALYSNSSDRQAPLLSSVQARALIEMIHVRVQAADDGAGVAQVVAVCDDGQGAWRTAGLRWDEDEETWTGTCSQPVSRLYVQVVDGGGNVTASAWQAVE